MAMTVQTHLQAKCIVSSLLYGGTADATGNLTWTLVGDIASKSGAATFDNIEDMFKANGVDVTPTDSPIKANLTETIEISGSVREMQSYTGSNFSTQLTNSYGFFKNITLFRSLAASTGGTFRVVVGRVASLAKPIGPGRNVTSFEYDGMGYSNYEGPTVPALYN